MQNMNYKKLEILINRNLTGEATTSEQKQLQKLISSSPDAKQFFESQKKLWEAFLYETEETSFDTKQNWEELRTQLEIPDEDLDMNSDVFNTINQPGKKLPGFIQWLSDRKVLAIAASFLFTGILVYYLMISDRVEQINSTKNGERREIVLSDNSVVKLNVASKLTITDDFGGKGRKVFLDGEAFFDVQKDGRTFIVETVNAQIRVLGTRFNIRSRNLQTEVAVEKGKVSLQNLSRNTRSEQILQNDQMSRCIQNTPPSAPELVKSEYVSAWMSNRLALNNRAFGDVLVELQRIFDTNIQLTDTTLAHRTITGIFNESDGIENILTAICAAVGAEFRLEKNTYIIKQR